MKLLTIVAVSALILNAPINAQIVIPQPSPYASDPNTVLLQHFDGSTTGSVHGTAGYDAGIFGQAVKLQDTSFVTWNMGALAQGTIEFWFKLDNLTNSANTAEGLRLASASYASNPVALTMSATANYNFEPYTAIGINTNPFNWVGVNGNTTITPGRWYHYAATWGGQGVRLYLNGNLIGTNPTPTSMNPNTGQWAVGAEVRHGNDGFNGVMDELRISNVERTFKPFLPLLEIRFETRTTQTYQIQSSTDLLCWVNFGSSFKGQTGVTAKAFDSPLDERRHYRVVVE